MFSGVHGMFSRQERVADVFLHHFKNRFILL